MSDTIDGAMHQKHEAILAEHGTEIKALHRGQDEMRGDIKTILSAVQSNSREDSNSTIKMLGTFGACLVGFMTLIILPMREDDENLRIEQDDENRLMWSSLKTTEGHLYSHAVEVAGIEGELRGKVESMQIQLNDIDNNGTRKSKK